LATDLSHAIAGVYASALFELAQEQNLGDAVHQDLEELAQLVETDAELAGFLENPALGHEDKAAVVTKVFHGKVSDLVLNLLMVLAQRDRLALVRDIRVAYNTLEDRHAGRIPGTLVTAVELSKTEQIRLTEQISRALRKTVVLQYAVDPAIIGGMVLTVEDTLLDGSVRCSLRQLGQQLRQEADRQMQGGKGRAFLAAT
jgi:F-type H+-transporting ATPase subunit delta